MTKADLVNKISAKTGIDRVTVQKAIEALIITVKDSMVDGNNVYLRGFGTFAIKQRAEKVARNISKGTAVIVHAHNIPSFKPSNDFLQKLK